MIFDRPLIQACLIRRYQRFLADVRLMDGKTMTVHCPNTGRMESCGSPGDTVYLSEHLSSKRKYRYSWEFTRARAGLVGINTGRSNRLAEEAIMEGLIPDLQAYSSLQREVKYGDGSRIDILLSSEKLGRCWIEVKNVTLWQNGQLYFPDTVTARGLKHLQELKKQKKNGDRCILFFVVNRAEGESVKPAFHLDPQWSETLLEAHTAGLEVMAFRAHNTLKGSKLTEAVPVDLRKEEENR